MRTPDLADERTLSFSALLYVLGLYMTEGLIVVWLGCCSRECWDRRGLEFRDTAHIGFKCSAI